MIAARYVLKSRIWLSPPAKFIFPKNQFCALHCGNRITSSDNRHCNRIISPSFAVTYSTSSNISPEETKPPTQIEKLKKTIADYGLTVVVFHVTISLISLGGFYLAVCSGLDVIGLLQKFGLNMSERMSGVVSGAGTFAIAYGVHKIFAPVRISITLGTTPFIVRYLRKIGLLKPPKK